MIREAEADPEKMIQEAEADQEKMTQEAEASLEKTPHQFGCNPFVRFVRNPVSITSDVLIVTCAAVEQRVMPSTLLERNTN